MVKTILKREYAVNNIVLNTPQAIHSSWSRFGHIECRCAGQSAASALQSKVEETQASIKAEADSDVRKTMVI